MRISNPKDMGGNKLLHRVNVATGGVIQGEGTETSPLTANVDAIASNVFPAFSGNSGKVLRVNANETGTEWAEMTSTGLSDDSKIVRYVKSYDDYLEVCSLAKEQEIHHSALFMAASDISGDFLEIRKSMDGDVVDDTLRKGHAYLRVDTSGLPSSTLQERTVSTSTYIVEKVKFVSRDGSAVSQTYDLLSGREDAHYIFPDSFEKASAGQYGITFKNREPALDASLNGGWPTAGVDISKRISAYKDELEKEGTYIGKTPWYLADTNVGITNIGYVFKKYEGAWHMGSVDCDPSLKFSEAFEENTKFDMVFLYKDSTGSYVETPTPNATVTTIENNGQYGGVAVEATIDITPDTHRLTIKALEGPYLEVSPGNAYSATLSANSTLTATGGEEGYHQEAYLDVNPGTYSLTPGNGITFVHDITASKVNYCRIVWTGTSARLLVDNVSDSSGESSSSSSSESSSSSGTTEGTITVSSQTIAGTAGTQLSYNLADYVTVSNGQTPTFALASGQVLPTGLSLSSNGVISGTTNVTGTTTIKVKVSASNCPDVEMTVNFNIAASTPQGTITVTTNPTIQGVVGTAITSYNLASCVTVSNGQTPSFRWNDVYSSQPSWLTLTETGMLSGTPSSVPTAPEGKVIVSAYKCSNEPNIIITWDIIAAGVITVSAQTIKGTVGTALSSFNLYDLTDVSNSQTPTFAVKSGTLPTGIDLSPEGVFTGTPTATSSATVVVQITARGCPDKEVNVTFNITEKQAGDDGFPRSFTVTSVKYQGQDTTAPCGTYTRTGEAFPVVMDGVAYPVYSYTGTDGKTYYICVVAYMFGGDAPAWMLTGTKPTALSVTTSYAASGYGGTTLKSGTYEPGDTLWSGISGNAVVSWEMGGGSLPGGADREATAFGNSSSVLSTSFQAVLQKYTYTGTFTVAGETFPYFTGNGSTPWYLFGGKVNEGHYALYLYKDNPKTRIFAWNMVATSMNENSTYRLLMLGKSGSELGTLTKADVTGDLPTTLLSAAKWWTQYNSGYDGTQVCDTIVWS